MLGTELDEEVIDALLPLILSKDILDPEMINAKLVEYAMILAEMFMEPTEEELNLEEGFDLEMLKIIMVNWQDNVATLSETFETDLFPFFWEAILTMTPEEMIALLEDPEALFEQYGIEFPDMSEWHPLAQAIFWICLLLTVLPVLYYAGVVCELREEIGELELEIDIEELLEAVLTLYVGPPEQPTTPYTT